MRGSYKEVIRWFILDFVDGSGWRGRARVLATRNQRELMPAELMVV